MLACLPGPGDLSLQLLPHSQMNTGLQKWDTTQRMRSAQCPTPAELDAYAKKVANSPLTIKIFPNSVKVPQRNHVRRTVNGLDTGGPRYSPYPQSQPTAKAGLLAIVKAPTAKGVVKDFAGTRARLHPEAMMSAPGGPYAPAGASTLTLHHGPQPLPRAPGQHQQGLPQHSQTLQPLQQPQPQQQQQQSGAQHQGHHPPSVMPQHPQGMGRTQPLSHPPALAHPGPQPPPPAVLLQQQQQQQHLQQPPPGLQGGARKLPDADAPPNVTVSTSTIPLSMAGALHQGRQADLSSIVHQINQFCQARAQGAGATSVCEGQIANPSPISRNLLINASSRVSMHGGHPGALMHPSCNMGPLDKAAAPAPVGAIPPHGMGTMNRMPMYHSDMKQHPQQHQQHQQHQHQQHQHPQQHQQQHPQQQHPQQQHPQQQHPQPLQHQQQHQNRQHHHQHQQQQQQQQQQMRSWNQHQLAHLQHISDGVGHPCKPPQRDPTGFPCKSMNYPPELCMGQPYTLKPPLDKPTPSPPVVNNNNNNNGMAHYANGQYYHQPPVWGSILPTPNSDSSGSQEMPMPFLGTATGSTNPAPGGVDCAPAGATAHYRPQAGVAVVAGQTNLMQTADYMGGDFQTPCFRDQNLGLMRKMHRPPPMGRVVAPPSEAHGQHPGYR